MRPPRIQHNALKYPLDDILGTPANVRLLRVLVHDIGGPVGVTDAARLSGLSTTGARKSLETLERLGIAVRIGTGRALKFGIAPGNPYLAIIRHLFEVENRQYEDLLQALRHAVAMPETKQAWLRPIPINPGEALEIDLVASAKAMSWIGNEVRSRLLTTEQEYNRIIELNIYTHADTPEVPEHAIVLWTDGDMSRIEQLPDSPQHSDSTERSLRMASAVADAIKTDPSLIRRALLYLNRQLQEGQGMANNDLGEWRQLLETYSTERLRDLLVSQSSRAMRLRRSTPFFAVLTPEERDQLIQRMELEQ